MPDDRSVEAAHRARFDAPPREIWAELDARGGQTQPPIWLTAVVFCAIPAVVALLIAALLALPP